MNPPPGAGRDGICGMLRISKPTMDEPNDLPTPRVEPRTSEAEASETQWNSRLGYAQATRTMQDTGNPAHRRAGWTIEMCQYALTVPFADRKRLVREYCQRRNNEVNTQIRHWQDIIIRKVKGQVQTAKRNVRDLTLESGFWFAEINKLMY